MKTLADVKRKMTLGSKWRCVRLFEGGKDLGVREVGKVQGNAVAFLKPDGKLVAMVAKGKGRAGGRKRLHRAPERSAQAQVHLCRIGVPEKIMQNNMN